MEWGSGNQGRDCRWKEKDTSTPVGKTDVFVELKSSSTRVRRSGEKVKDEG